MERTRLLSLDFFRGATVVAMITVNNPGTWDTVFSPLRHAPWNGCTPTDLIFPFFLFIVGVSIHFAFRDRRHEEVRSKNFRARVKQLLLINILQSKSVADYQKINKVMKNKRFKITKNTNSFQLQFIHKLYICVIHK